MSGGSWEYVYRQVQEAAERLCEKESTQLRKLLGKHLILVAKALHDIEWVDSGDMTMGDEDEAIMECLKDE